MKQNTITITYNPSTKQWHVQQGDFVPNIFEQSLNAATDILRAMEWIRCTNEQ